MISNQRVRLSSCAVSRFDFDGLTGVDTERLYHKIPPRRAIHAPEDRSCARPADASSVATSGRTPARQRTAAGSVHHYPGEDRPTLRMPSAQLRALMLELLRDQLMNEDSAAVADGTGVDNRNARDLERDPDDALDDFSDDVLRETEFDAQPTTYRVRTTTLDDLIASLPRR